MRRTLSIGAAVLAGCLLATSPAGAQGRGYAKVPPGQRPPAGLCRVWIDGVPPGRQPGVTDCAYAYAHVPANGRVIYGGRASDRSYVQNRQYAPYYYGAPTQGDPNSNYIQRLRDRLDATRAQSGTRRLRLQQQRDQQATYSARGDRYAPVYRAGDDERSGKKSKHGKEHGNGHGHGHGKHGD